MQDSQPGPALAAEPQQPADALGDMSILPMFEALVGAAAREPLMPGPFAESAVSDHQEAPAEQLLPSHPGPRPRPEPQAQASGGQSPPRVEGLQEQLLAAEFAHLLSGLAGPLAAEARPQHSEPQASQVLGQGQEQDEPAASAPAELQLEQGQAPELTHGGSAVEVGQGSGPAGGLAMQQQAGLQELQGHGAEVIPEHMPVSPGQERSTLEE